jgi:phage minor structural protein
MKKQIKVAYFPSTATKSVVLGSNGKSLDKYCIKCDTDEDLSSGNYVLDATFLIEDNLLDLLQEECILKVLMDYGEEVFRVSKVKASTRYIDVVARQITIAEELSLWLEDVRPTNMSASGAAGYLVSNATGTKEIQVISDIQTVSTAYYMRMNLYKALHDTEQSFLNRWGGEVLRRGYIEYINNHIGIDRGVTIREGKNLTGFESSSNIDTLVTRGRGQGYDGILGNYIDSPLINNYNRIYTEVIKYDDVKVKDENNDEGYDTLAQAQAELDRRIKEEYSKNGIDKIKASYNINFVQLEKTEEYKNYIIAERVYLGDTIRVYIPKLNTDIKVIAIAKKYDVLAQKTKEIELSNYIEPKSLSIKQIIDRLESIDSTDTILQQAKDNATSLINAGMKNSYVIVRQNEILIMDTKDINTATKVWRWNQGALGYSSTGYNGTYGTAISQDGSIVADFITTGVLNANLIKTGTILSKDGKVSMNLDNGNLDVKGGALTVTNGNGTVVIDGKYNMHKIVASGALQLTMEVGVTTRTATVSHNLGYKPCNSAYAELETGGVTYVYSFPYISYNNLSSNSLGITTLGRCWASPNLLEFIFVRSQDSANKSESFKIRYYIYKEVAI